MRRQGELGFTMIEIAMAIGVIGFALVAIIGILPRGMNVQKDAREDTTISQDAPYFMDAIRNGIPIGGAFNSRNYYPANGLDFLTNYVQSITYTGYKDGVATWITNWYVFTNGAQIIGLLCDPQNNYNNVNFASNYFTMTATVRALGGPAILQQGGPNSGMNSFMAFTYKMEVMVIPYGFNNYVAPDSVAFNNYASNSEENIVRYNRWLATYNQGPGYTAPAGLGGPILNTATGALGYNLYTLRLRFSWPVTATGTVGPGRQTYSTLVAEPITSLIDGTNTLWFFQPQTFTNTPPANL